MCLPEVDAEVGLLTANDVPEILDPLELKHRQDGAPYVSRTVVGWVVNGPLGQCNRSPHTSSFFFKADRDLNQMLKDYFLESSADDKPDMSQEELRFLRVLSLTLVLKEGH